jgi:hypothetical protein
MSTLKTILLFLAVGTTSLMMAGCYGVSYPSIESEDELVPPASEPVEGLETQSPATPDTKP